MSTRQFFVGGNWKLNPTSVGKAKELVEVLNKADLDPNTGAQLPLPLRKIALNDRARVERIYLNRGRHSRVPKLGAGKSVPGGYGRSR